MGYKKDGQGKSGGRPAKSFGRSSGPSKFTPRNSSNDSRPFVRKSFGAKPAGKGNFELFDTTCARCGKDCQIPFRPTGQKPVFCRDCFNKNDDSGSSRNFSPRPTSNSSSSDDLSEINRKLDKIMKAMRID